MTEKIEKLSMQELHMLAGEIVRNLDGGAREGGGAAAYPDTLALLRAVSEESGQNTAEKLQLAIAAAAAVLAQADMTASAEDTATGLQSLTFKSAAAAPTQASAARLLDEFPQEAAARRQDVEPISEFFRRDSRRYDAGFERF